MKLMLQREAHALIPATPTDQEKFEKLRFSTWYKTDMRKARNPDHHRKGFALVKLIFESQERYENMEDLRTELKLQCGSYTQHVRANGEIVYLPMSWSFADMDQTQFDELYDRLIDVATNHYGLKEAVEFI